MKKILIVDDEVSIANALTREIKPWCADNEIEIIISTFPAEVQILVEKDKDIFLMITDNVMPVLTGKNLAKIVKSINPEIFVFLMTGYPNIDIIVKLNNPDITATINKPWNHKILIIELEKALKSYNQKQLNKN